MPLNAAEEKALADTFAPGLEGTPAAQSVSDLTEEDLADLLYHQKKTSGQLDRERTHRALEQQVQMLRCKGGL